MADLTMDTEVPPATPAAGTGVWFVDSVAKQGTIINDAGRAFTIGGEVRNWSTADQTLTGVGDTYLTGSNLSIPPHLLQVGSRFRWAITATKTAGAGTAAPIFVVRIGTAGTVADAAILTFTQVSLQTAAADAGVWEIAATLRNTGAAGILAGHLTMTHILAATGFSSIQSNVQQVTSAGFATTTASLIAGVSLNNGAGTISWTIQSVFAEVMNI